MNTIESTIKEEIEEILYLIASNSYNDMYSSIDYGYANKYLEYSLGALINISNKLQIDISSLKGRYCDYTVSIKDYDSLDELLRHL